MADDLFAPPTKDELQGVKPSASSDLFAPPTKDEIASSNPSAGDEPFMHKVIREGLPLAGQVGGGLIAGALATPETMGVGTLPAGLAGGAAGQAAGGEAAGWLNHEIYGDPAPTYNSLGDAKRVGANMAIGAASELGGRLAGKAVGGALAPNIATKEAATGLFDASGNPIMKTVEDTAEAASASKSGPISKIVDKAVAAVGAAVGAQVGHPGIGAAVALGVKDSVAGIVKAAPKALQKSPAFVAGVANLAARASTQGLIQKSGLVPTGMLSPQNVASEGQ